jgi:hypothetical protein
VQLALEPDEVVRCIQERLALPDCPCRGFVAEVQRVIDLRMPPEEKHLWSPALGLQIEANSEQGKGSVVHALIGPEPAVWTAIAFCYVALITGLLFTVTFGAVQNFLGQSPWAFWIAGAMLLAMLAVWWIARAGKQLAAPQTVVLRHFLEDALGLDRSQRELTDADPYHG